MSSRVSIIKSKKYYVIDFNETSVYDGIYDAVKLLLAGHKYILCKNLNITKNNALLDIQSAVVDGYKKMCPKSALSPEFILDDFAGNDTDYFARLNRKIIV